MYKPTGPRTPQQSLHTPANKSNDRERPLVVAARTPTAPPVYRPQPPRGVMQRQTAPIQSQVKPQPKPQPVAPPVYRPQPVPKVLQAKKAAVPRIVNQTRTPQPAPSAYHPGPIPRVLQRKMAVAHHPSHGTQSQPRPVIPTTRISPFRAVIQRAEAPLGAPPPAAGNAPANAAEQWDPRISAAARTAMTQLRRLEQACPSLKPSTDKDIAARVKYLKNQHLKTLQNETKQFNARTVEADKPAMRQLRYNRSWNIPDYIREQPVGDFEALINDLEGTQTPTPAAAAGRRDDPAHIKEVRGWVQRCLALPRVNSKTESGKAKQINTANAKTLQEISAVLEDYNLTEAETQFFKDARGRINGRIQDAAESNGADFKSCDSAVISTETQLQRAENYGEVVTPLTPPSSTETTTTTTTTL